MTATPMEVLETLRQDEGLVLYRSLSEVERTPVLVLTAAGERPPLESLKRLELEYALREELDAGWAARPLALLRQRGHPMLVLTDPGGELLSRLLGQPWPLQRFLPIAAGLALALGRAHERGLVHKDLKPAHVLVDTASGTCWLTGFALASRPPREPGPPDSPERIAGTLAYIAPEQTGRMNRPVDLRSDLYSLGMIFYEMLTGALPFSATEPLEWIHCHVARQPVPPADRVRGLPAVLSAIVMKLLAKTAEARYQSAAGLEADLRGCLSEWTSHGRIDAFALGSHDVSDRLAFPEKLVGRSREIAALLAAFERVADTGRVELVLLAGYSGVGKSSVVNELAKTLSQGALVPGRGAFAAGKFDQYRRDIPYATLAQAFQGLVRPLLGQSTAELARWQERLREALGQNGKLIANLVPELELILGAQPPVAELAPEDAQRRFQAVLRRFLGVFARPEQPLALFLDDLQWLDQATLDLLAHLSTEPELRHVLVIGAYRDNEAGPLHRLTRTLDGLRRSGARMQEIVLAPLDGENVTRLVAQALRVEPDRARSLAELVQEKTAGNPFFAIQFIAALAEDGLLPFDRAASAWTWDLERLRSRGFTDNVADLMAGKLARLPAPTHAALQTLACLGSRAETGLLSLVHGQPVAALDAALADAVSAGLIARDENTYAFLHDRVQEAAYALIADSERSAAHLRIGRILLAKATPEQVEDTVFEIVSQLNRGAPVITAAEERGRAAELNLIAGRRAKAATAYASALAYFSAGAALLGDQWWQRSYPLVFSLKLERAECELLTGAVAAAGELLAMLSDRAIGPVDRAAVTRLRVRFHTALSQPERAIEVCLEYLRDVGVAWSLHPTDAQVADEFARLWRGLGTRPIEALVDLPAMSDPVWRATMDVLSEARRPAQYTDRNLYRILLGRMANLSLEHGNSDGSCVAYAWLGLALGPWLGDHQAGFRFGQLSADLVDRHALDRFRTRVYLCLGSSSWARRPEELLAYPQRAFDWAQQTGDYTGLAYAYNLVVAQRLIKGDALGEIQDQAESALAFVQKARLGVLIDQVTGHVRLIRALRGLTDTFGSFTDADFDESRFEQHLQSDPALGLPACWYWIRKLQARRYAADYAAAVEAAGEAQRLLWTTQSHFEIADYHFHAALARAGACDEAAGTSDGADRKPEHLDALVAHHRELTVWAQHAPAHFGNRAALVAAEVARLEGREAEAMRLYEEAIGLAGTHGFIQNEAVANELAAQFYATRGFQTIAHAYRRNARHCYLRWGAEGKVRQLEQAHPHLREPPDRARAPVLMKARQDELDLATVIRMSHALSGEIVLDRLVETLMALAVEHAGAQRGLLILHHGEEQRIEAEATTGPEVSVRLLAAPASPESLPESVLQYALRTRHSVILDDACAQQPFCEDPYIARTRARSVLCLPLLKQAELTGLLYLENNLATHVFTPGRISVLELMASQAAISLENARLYGERQQAEAALRQSEQRFRDYAQIASDWLWEAGPDHRFTWFSKPVVPRDDPNQRIGFSRLEIGADLDEEPEKWRAHEAALAAHEPFRDFTYRTIQSDGSTAYIAASGKPVFDAEGRFCGYRGVGSDVTAKVRAEQAEQALLQAQAALAHVARVTTLGELAASIAHEINQPLAAIVADASACLNWLDSGRARIDDLHEALTGIVSDGGRAAQVLTRIRALLARSSTTRGPCDLEAIIAGVLPLVGSALTRDGIALDTAIEAGLPQVVADPVELQQVFLNLLVNAVDASREVAPERRRVRIGARPDGRWVTAEIEDAGIGIGTVDPARLFDAFYTTKPEGLGMGLSISRSIIERHGGRLWATANPEHGVTFHFQLPEIE